MKKFVFRPQVVLDRARDEEEQALQQMAGVQRELVEKDQEIARVADEHTSTLQAMTAAQQQTFEVEDIQRQRLHIDALNHLQVKLRDERALIQQRLDAAREALIEAMRKRQVLEKLRETHYTAYQKETQKQELQIMEDVKLPRLARDRMENAM
jgi:flagellar protein FliJ